MKKKKKQKYSPKNAMLSNSIYAVNGVKNKKPTKQESLKYNNKIVKESKDNLNKGMTMAKIEAYAKKT